MDNIQITMGAVETLNERINILQDELESLTTQKNALKTQINASSLKDASIKLFRILALISGCILAFLGLLSLFIEDGFPMFIIFGLLGAGLLWLYFDQESNSVKNQAHIYEKLQKLEHSISKKQNELNEYKQKKKDLILEHERKLNDNMNEIIDDSFSFNDVNETKECPMCAETVKAKAKKCRYCGYNFEN